LRFCVQVDASGEPSTATRHDDHPDQATQRERRSDDGRVVLVDQLAAATETLTQLVPLVQQQPIP
jgi:hypothetical protein